MEHHTSAASAVMAQQQQGMTGLHIFTAAFHCLPKRSEEMESEPLHTRRQPQSFPLRCVCSKSVSLQKKKHPDQLRLRYRSLGGSQNPLQAVWLFPQKWTFWPWIASFCLQPRWPLLHVLLLWSRDGATAERDAGTVQKALKCNPPKGPHQQLHNTRCHVGLISLS